MSFLKPCHVPFRKLIPPFILTAKVNTDRTSVSRVIPKTIHCLIFALRATNAYSYYSIQTGRNLPNVRDLKNVRCFSSLMALSKLAS